MQKQTKKFIVAGSVIAGVIVLYIIFQGIIFFIDKSILQQVQSELSIGNYQGGLETCQKLHYWRNSTCTSLSVAVTILQEPDSLIEVCTRIPLIYDGPWWLPAQQKYIDSLLERRQACITKLLTDRGLGSNSA